MDSSAFGSEFGWRFFGWIFILGLVSSIGWIIYFGVWALNWIMNHVAII